VSESCVNYGKPYGCTCLGKLCNQAVRENVPTELTRRVWAGERGGGEPEEKGIRQPAYRCGLTGEILTRGANY